MTISFYSTHDKRTSANTANMAAEVEADRSFFFAEN